MNVAALKPPTVVYHTSLLTTTLGVPPPPKSCHTLFWSVKVVSIFQFYYAGCIRDTDKKTNSTKTENNLLV